MTVHLDTDSDRDSDYRNDAPCGLRQREVNRDLGLKLHQTVV